jgi:phosphatidylinositol alpha-1,6-mannosyltransferase
MAPLAVVLSKLSDAKLWVQLHGIEAWQPLSWACNQALHRAALMTAVSRYTRRRLLAWLSVDPNKVKVLPNTVNAHFTPGPKPAHLIEQFGLEGRKILLTVSRLAASDRYKGQDRVIRALPTVLHACPTAIYLIVGDGDDRDRLEALAHSTGVGSFVRFVGQVANENLLDYYRLADIFVMPSTGEGFGIVFLEACSTGLSVIGGRADGSIDALADGQLGALVDPCDVPAIANAIIAKLKLVHRRSKPTISRFDFVSFASQVDKLLGNLVQ